MNWFFKNLFEISIVLFHYAGLFYILYDARSNLTEAGIRLAKFLFKLLKVYKRRPAW